MFIEDNLVAFDFLISKTEVDVPSMDIVITAPNGKNLYHDGGSGLSGYSYVKATELVVGSLNFNYTFDAVGLWQVQLGTGTCANFETLNKYLLNVVKHDNVFAATISLG